MKECTNYPADNHTHIMKKTVDLAWDTNYLVNSPHLVEMYKHVFMILKQKSICIVCGYETWEEIK